MGSRIWKLLRLPLLTVVASIIHFYLQVAIFTWLMSRGVELADIPAAWIELGLFVVLWALSGWLFVRRLTRKEAACSAAIVAGWCVLALLAQLFQPLSGTAAVVVLYLFYYVLALFWGPVHFLAALTGLENFWQFLLPLLPFLYLLFARKPGHGVQVVKELNSANAQEKKE